jgi:hypothetical protein
MIAGESFATKDAVNKRCRELVGDLKIAHSLEDTAQVFLFDLLQHHPDWKVKTQRTPIDQLELTIDYCYNAAHPCFGLHIVHKPTGLKLDDISWKWATRSLKPNATK